MIFIIGVTVTVMNPHSKSIWQSQTPPEMQGRVFSVLRVASQFTWPLGTALAGWIGGLFNPGLVLAVMGVVFLVFSLWQLSNKVLLAVEQ
jgi:MFS-type transporter involved in bile tolerance (Atg22 family)